MWVKCYRIGLPLFLSETNNPAEIIHKQTKAFGKKSNGMAKCIKDNLGYFAYSKSDIGQKSFLSRTKTVCTQSTGSIERDSVTTFHRLIISF